MIDCAHEYPSGQRTLQTVCTKCGQRWFRFFAEFFNQNVGAK